MCHDCDVDNKDYDGKIDNENGVSNNHNYDESNGNHNGLSYHYADVNNDIDNIGNGTVSPISKIMMVMLIIFILRILG